jgi:hypothetical protein
MILHWLVKALQPTQMSERPLFWNGAATELKLWRRGHLQWHELPTEFHEIYRLIQKFVEGQTDT